MNLIDKKQTDPGNNAGSSMQCVHIIIHTVMNSLSANIGFPYLGTFISIHSNFVQTGTGGWWWWWGTFP